MRLENKGSILRAPKFTLEELEPQHPDNHDSGTRFVENKAPPLDPPPFTFEEENIQQTTYQDKMKPHIEPLLILKRENSAPSTAMWVSFGIAWLFARTLDLKINFTVAAFVFLRTFVHFTVAKLNFQLLLCLQVSLCRLDTVQQQQLRSVFVSL